MAPPLNDLPANAIALAAGSGSRSGTTVDATPDVVLPGVPGWDEMSSVWYYFADVEAGPVDMSITDPLDATQCLVGPGTPDSFTVDAQFYSTTPLVDYAHIGGPLTVFVGTNPTEETPFTLTWHTPGGGAVPPVAVIRPSIDPPRLLDLDRDVAQVGASFRFDLVNRFGGVLGTVHPALGVSMTNDTNASIFRSIQSFRLQQSEWRDIRIFEEYVRPYFVLADGSQWPLGVLGFTSNPITEGSKQSWLDATLADQRFVLDQQMGYAFSILNGEPIDPYMHYICEYFGFTADRRDIINTGHAIGGGPVAWPPDATGITILEALCQRCGLHRPYFDNDGILTIRPPLPLLAGISHDYQRKDGRIRTGSLVYEANLLSAPNAFRVVSSSAHGVDIFGIAYLDPNLPHSRENRGVTIWETVNMPGLLDENACVQAAAVIASESSPRYATQSLESVPDPRHDTFDIVAVDGEPWREVSWTMELKSGGRHSHRLGKDAVFDIDPR